MAYNKVVYGGKVLIDLTSDTVTKERILSGITAHDKKGDLITGNFLQGNPNTLSIVDPVTGETITYSKK